MAKFKVGDRVKIVNSDIFPETIGTICHIVAVVSKGDIMPSGRPALAKGYKLDIPEESKYFDGLDYWSNYKRAVGLVLVPDEDETLDCTQAMQFINKIKAGSAPVISI